MPNSKFTPKKRLNALPFLLNAKEGFTLIEVLVAVSIASLAGVIALPGLRSFADRQQLTNAYQQIQTAINLTRSNAQNKTICANSGLASTDWRVTFVSSTQFKIDAVCVSLSTQSTFTITDTSYIVSSTASPTVSCGSNTYVNFNNATGQADLYCGGSVLPLGTNLQIVTSLNSKPTTTKTIIINHGGSVSEN